jgi:hypothetical protein
MRCIVVHTNGESACYNNEYNEKTDKSEVVEYVFKTKHEAQRYIESIDDRKYGFPKFEILKAPKETVERFKKSR